MEGKEDQPPVGQLHFLRSMEPTFHTSIVAINHRGLFCGQSFVYAGEYHKKTITACHKPDREPRHVVFFQIRRIFT